MGLVKTTLITHSLHLQKMVSLASSCLRGWFGCPGKSDWSYQRVQSIFDFLFSYKQFGCTQVFLGSRCGLQPGWDIFVPKEICSIYYIWDWCFGCSTMLISSRTKPQACDCKGYTVLRSLSLSLARGQVDLLRHHAIRAFYAIHLLPPFLANPQHDHWDAALWVVWHLKSNPGQRILLTADSCLTITAWCNSD